jgi:hypothetical protein
MDRTKIKLHYTQSTKLYYFELTCMKCAIVKGCNEFIV